MRSESVLTCGVCQMMPDVISKKVATGQGRGFTSFHKSLISSKCSQVPTERGEELERVQSAGHPSSANLGRLWVENAGKRCSNMFHSCWNSVLETYTYDQIKVQFNSLMDDYGTLQKRDRIARNRSSYVKSPAQNHWVSWSLQVCDNDAEWWSLSQCCSSSLLQSEAQGLSFESNAKRFRICCHSRAACRSHVFWVDRLWGPKTFSEWNSLVPFLSNLRVLSIFVCIVELVCSGAILAWSNLYRRSQPEAWLVKLVIGSFPIEPPRCLAGVATDRNGTIRQRKIKSPYKQAWPLH